MLKQFTCMWTPVFFCQLLRKLAPLVAVRSPLRCLRWLVGSGSQTVWPSSVALLEKSDSCRHRENVISAHICERDAGSCFSLLWDSGFETTSWPSACAQVEGYYWFSVRKQAHPSSVLCLLFYMVIRPLLLKDCAIWLRAMTPDCQRTCELYLSG